MTMTHQREAAPGAAHPPEAAATAVECRAQAGLYRLLGRVLEAEADAPLLASLRGELREPLAEIGIAFDEDFFTAQEAALLEALAEEYTGLLVAPGGVSPYASVFETGRTFQAPADRAEAAYREAGFEFRRRMSGEFPDHMGTMLAFVGILYDAEAEALEDSRAGLAAQARVRRERFVLEQLGPWGPGWCRRAGRAALHPFYGQVLALTEQVLWTELQALAGRRRLKELARLNAREPVKLDYDADFRKASGL